MNLGYSKKMSFLIGLGVGIIVLFLLFVSGTAFGSQDHQDDNNSVCHEWEKDCKPPHHEVTLTPKPTLTPTPTPKKCWKYCEEVTPTPTVTVTPPVAQPQEAGASGSSNDSTWHSPTCTLTLDAPILQGFDVTSDTSVFWHWWPSKSGITKQWIEYGYEKGNYPYSVFIPTNVTGFEIGSLQKGLVRWARIGVSDDSGCVAYSNDLDP